MSHTYPVNEIFQSIQGEATFTGTPSIFVRLQGCPVGCHWCDTKHTWEISGKVIPIENMISKSDDSELYSEMTVSSLLYELSKFEARHIVLTGGEPCMHDLTELTNQLIYNGYSVQIETSGTFPIKANSQCFITVSPKLGMAGGMKLLDHSLIVADEVKYPVGKLQDIENLKFLLEKTYCESIWLQPLSQSQKATDLCIEQATKNGWRVSIQTHKFLGVR